MALLILDKEWLVSCQAANCLSCTSATVAAQAADKRHAGTCSYWPQGCAELSSWFLSCTAPGMQGTSAR